MPFKKGENKYQLLGGRKGYEFEKQDLKRMTTLFRRYLTLAETIEKGKATENQKDAFERLRALVLKIADKLHANKQDVKVDFERPLLIKGI